MLCVYHPLASTVPLTQWESADPVPWRKSFPCGHTFLYSSSNNNRIILCSNQEIHQLAGQKQTIHYLTKHTASFRKEKARQGLTSKKNPPEFQSRLYLSYSSQSKQYPVGRSGTPHTGACWHPGPWAWFPPAICSLKPKNTKDHTKIKVLKTDSGFNFLIDSRSFLFNI